jgi:signal transduction histidine kinase
MAMSFRTRLFVVATLIVSTVLVLVISLGWSRVLSFEVERLDERLCSEARRMDGHTRRWEDLNRLEVDVMGKLRLVSTDQLMFRFEALDGPQSFQSSHWHPELSVDSLRWETARTRYGPVNRGDSRPPALDQTPGRGEEAVSQGVCSVSSFGSEAGSWRVAMIRSPDGRSIVAADLAATKADLQSALQSALMLVVPLALALSALGAWMLAAMTMRPVNRLRDSMRNVTQKALDQRLPTVGEDIEFRELIGAYNTMLERLQASFQHASRFSADAAHELRTPLTILRGRLEEAVNKSNNRAVQAELTDLQDEVSRLSGIVRKLLLLSQADAGRLALTITEIDLSAMLGEMLSDTEMLLGGQKLSSAIEPHLMTQGDTMLLRQLFNNLISNAVRYCQVDGAISIAGRALPGGTEGVFSNTCEPVLQESRARFFDRFFRGEASHNRSVEGNGLGLSLAREIARAHGGDLTLEPSALDLVKVRLFLPKV